MAGPPAAVCWRPGGRLPAREANKERICSGTEIRQKWLAERRAAVAE